MITLDIADALIEERYRLRRVVGRGGGSTVYAATDERLDRLVALKVWPAQGESPQQRRQQAEGTLLAGLSHPGLVRVFDTGVDLSQEPPVGYLAMELVDGPSLAEVLHGGAQGEARTRELGTQVAEALAYVHEAGVVHRDIKPANVLLAPGNHFKLTDFGAACRDGGTRWTTTGTMLGTAAYLSPEQVRGEPLTPATDVYSLGLVLLECLNGAVEYPGSPVEAAVARLHRSPVVPERLEPSLRTLLAAMCADDPVVRPTAGEVAFRLSAGTSIEALPVAQTQLLPAGTALLELPPELQVTAEESRRPAVGRHVRIAALAAAASFGVLGLVSWASGGDPSSTPATHPSVAPTRPAVTTSPAPKVVVQTAAPAVAGHGKGHHRHH